MKLRMLVLLTAVITLLTALIAAYNTYTENKDYVVRQSSEGDGSPNVSGVQGDVRIEN
jgi:hypothetical protein